MEAGNSELGLVLLKRKLLGLIYDQTEVFKQLFSSGPEIHEAYVMWRKLRTQTIFM